MGRLVLLISFLLLSQNLFEYRVLNETNHHSILKTFTAKVVGITDCDTMEVLFNHSSIKIRLLHIDCPEKKGSQPFGSNAKMALSNMCFGQQVTVHADKYDRYKRLLAIVINNKGQDVNQEMAKKGLAWHFKRYSSNQVYADLEHKARQSRLGLWQDPNPIPPWEWRKIKHKFRK